MSGPAVALRAAGAGDVGAISAVRIATWQTTYVGMLPDDFLAGMPSNPHVERNNEVLRRSIAAGDEVVLVAEAVDGDIVGFIHGGAERGGDPDHHHEIYALYVLAGHQGQGIGRRLTEALLLELPDTAHSLLVWVLADNPGRGFYERLGGRYLRTQPIDISGTVIDEVAYGWRDSAGVLATVRRGA